MQELNKRLAIAVGAGLNSIHRISLAFNDRTAIHIKNVGANALSAFEIHARFHPDADQVKIAGAAADYTTPSGLIAFARTNANAALDPTVLGAGAGGAIVVDTRGMVELDIKATCAAGTTLDVLTNGD